jgi:hypothetical protein
MSGDRDRKAWLELLLGSEPLKIGLQGSAENRQKRRKSWISHRYRLRSRASGLTIIRVGTRHLFTQKVEGGKIGCSVVGLRPLPEGQCSVLLISPPRRQYTPSKSEQRENGDCYVGKGKNPCAIE